MKKLIALILSICLIAGLSTSTLAAAKKKVKKAKKVVKKVVKKKAVKKAPVEPETPWTPPTPAPVAPAPTAAPAAAGMGLSIGGKVGMVAGATGIIGNLDYSIASMIPGAKVRVTADYLTGTNGGATYKVVDLGLGGIYALDMLKNASMPIDWYVGGSVLVPVKVSGGGSGSYGLTAVIGGNYLIPDFGTLSGELGYGALKYSKTASAVKGVIATIGYSYAF